MRLMMWDQRAGEKSEVIFLSLISPNPCLFIHLKEAVRAAWWGENAVLM